LLLSYAVRTILVLPGVSWYQSLASYRGNFSLVFINSACCLGWHGQVPNEEVVPYYERNIQDVMIEDLEMWVAQLTRRLAVQNWELYHNIDCHDSQSNFKNPYNNPVVVGEWRCRMSAIES
jgi:hypothetical protein